VVDEHFNSLTHLADAKKLPGEIPANVREGLDLEAFASGLRKHMAALPLVARSIAGKEQFDHTFQTNAGCAVTKLHDLNHLHGFAQHIHRR
jgi:hypothetical protein